MTETFSFLMQPKLLLLAILSSNHWFYGFGATSFQTFFYWTFIHESGFFSHFPKIDSFHWLNADVQLIIDMALEKNLWVLMASTLYSCMFYTEVLVFVGVFRCLGLVEMIVD